MDHIDHGRLVLCFFEYLDLSVRPCAILQHGLRIPGRLPAAQRIEHIIHKIQQLIDQHPGIDLLLFAKVDQVTVDTISAGPPFILIDQRPRILYIVHVPAAQLVDLYTDGLEQRGDTDGLIHCHGYITDPELHRIEEWVNPQVPPDLFGVVDTVGLHQQLFKAIISLDTFERLGYPCTWELVEYFCPERFVTRMTALPERRVGAERIAMGQEVAGGVGDMVGHLPAFHADMHMQSEDEVAARGLLQLVD